MSNILTKNVDQHLSITNIRKWMSNICFCCVPFGKTMSSQNTKCWLGIFSSDTVWVESVCPIFVSYLFKLDQDYICSILKIAFSSMKAVSPGVFSKNSSANNHNQTFYLFVLFPIYFTWSYMVFFQVNLFTILKI